MEDVEYTFIRNLSLKKGEHHITMIAQPYVIGMYVAVEDSKLSQPLQLAFEHKGFIKWITKFIRDHEKEGYATEKVTRSYVDFLKKEDFDHYVKGEIDPKSKKKKIK